MVASGLSRRRSLASGGSKMGSLGGVSVMARRPGNGSAEVVEVTAMSGSEEEYAELAA
jgi:hypothetical protein